MPGTVVLATVVHKKVLAHSGETALHEVVIVRPCVVGVRGGGRACGRAVREETLLRGRPVGLSRVGLLR